MPDLRSTLAEHFGHDVFRPGQAEAIGHLRQDYHTLVVMPTGSGATSLARIWRTPTIA